jgi:4-diphosphocytidyl-2-C-methyl-D-erythritol kinase
MPTRVRSFSKINLGLAVGPARADGFHGLTTVYQTLALHEIVTVSARRAPATVLRLTANHPWVPRTETGNGNRNTAWKIVALALERLGITAEVDIDIAKELPVQGGLGAGSANAAAALLGLERELGVALSGPARLTLAAEIGSDVPLFLLGGTVLGLGRGEEVYPLPDSPRLPCVIAVPGAGVSTALAFRELDARGSWWKRDEVAEEGGSERHTALTSSSAADRLNELSRALASVWTTTGVEHGPSGIASTISPEPGSGNSLPSRSMSSGSLNDETSAQATAEVRRDVQGDLAENPILALVRTGIENDFEEVVFSQHPSLRSTKRDLMGSSGSPGNLGDGPVVSGGSGESGESGGGALYVALSGSGSALFGIYGSQADARAAQHRVQQNGTRAIVTETLPRRVYWRTMFAE